MSAATKALLKSYKTGYRAPRSRAAIQVHETVRMVPAPRRRRHHSGLGLSLGGLGAWSGVLIPAGAGYAVASLEASDFWSNVPSLPLLGKKGTLALALQVTGLGRSGWLREIKVGCALLAGYELKKTGSISGF